MSRFSPMPWGLNATVLKLIALLSMTIDHIGYFLFPQLFWLRMIGRLAFPLFGFMIAEGCRYTHHKLRYFLQVCSIGVASSVVAFIVSGTLYQNTLITFSLSILTIFALHFLKETILQQGSPSRRFLGILWATGILGADLCLGLPLPVFSSIGFGIDYGVAGIFLPVLVYVVPNQKYWKLLALLLGCIALLVQGGTFYLCSVFAVVVLFFYNGKRGRFSLKYFFYLYYPIHVAILGAIAELLHIGTI